MKTTNKATTRATMTRKEFLGSVVKGAAGAVGLAALVAACGGDDGGGGGGSGTPDAPAAASCTMNGTTDTISNNHGHVISVTKDDVTAGVDKTYDIMGTSAHTHSVTVTAAMFTMLQGNTQVTVTSTTGTGHTHDVTIKCA